MKARLLIVLAAAVLGVGSTLAIMNNSCRSSHHAWCAPTSDIRLAKSTARSSYHAGRIGFAGHAFAADRGEPEAVRTAMAATADGLLKSACLLMFGGENARGPFIQFAADARPAKNAAAARVEELYNGFPAGTDTEGNEGYNAAQKAEEQLKLDFLSSFQNPQKNSANQTAWDEEEAQLISDSLKYGGDRTLDAAATYWGETYFNLPLLSPQELLAQAKTLQIADQVGEREFAEHMANYLANRFDSLNTLASSYRSATHDIEGRKVPLDLADLQAELRIDEFDRTRGKSGPL